MFWTRRFAACTALITAGVLAPTPAAAQWTQWTTANGGNNHWYQLTTVAGTWTDAQANAASLGGYLVTTPKDLSEVLLVSEAADPLLRATDVGPAWLTGGEYGIEGGLACTIALLASIVMIQYLPGLKADEELLALTSPKRLGS